MLLHNILQGLRSPLNEHIINNGIVGVYLNIQFDYIFIILCVGDNIIVQNELVHPYGFTDLSIHDLTEPDLAILIEIMLSFDEGELYDFLLEGDVVFVVEGGQELVC